MTLVARHGALTDIGLHRKTNEDTFVVQPPLFVVCDGMGGAQAGEVASGLAAETLAERVAAGRPLLEAAEAANAAVFQRANDNIEQTGMGTTLTAFVLEPGAAHFVHIGDSRAYLLREGELQQVTDDHSLVGEMVRDGRLTEADAAVHPHRSILSRALGTEPRARIDEFAVDLRPDDVILLCSDGLSGPVDTAAIRAALLRDDPQAAADRLVKEARKQGGPDNITAVVVRFEEQTAVAPREAEEETAVLPADDTEDTGEMPVVDAGATASPASAAAGGAPPDGGTVATAEAAEAPATAAGSEEPSPAPPAGAATDPALAGEPPAASAAEAAARRRSVRRLGFVAAALAVLAVALSAGAIVLSTVFYIGVDDGRLTIYSGIPAEIGPVKLHAVYRRSVRTYESLSATQRQIVDSEELRSKDSVMSVSEQLGMWP